MTLYDSKCVYRCFSYVCADDKYFLKKWEFHKLDNAWYVQGDISRQHKKSQLGEFNPNINRESISKRNFSYFSGSLNQTQFQNFYHIRGILVCNLAFYCDEIIKLK